MSRARYYPIINGDLGMKPFYDEADFAKLRQARRAAAGPKVLTVRQRAERNRCQETNIRTRKIGRSGEMDRSILVEIKISGVEHRYHATKGWRRTVLALRA